MGQVWLVGRRLGVVVGGVRSCAIWQNVTHRFNANIYIQEGRERINLDHTSLVLRIRPTLVQNQLPCPKSDAGSCLYLLLSSCDYTILTFSFSKLRRLSRRPQDIC